MKTQEEYFNDLKKGTSLVELQNYINNVLEIRGFNNQSIELKLMLLMEEVGELAKSIRKDSTSYQLIDAK